MSVLKLVLLHLCIFGAQAFYMFLANKEQMKSKRILFLIAIPIVIAVPIILNSQDAWARNLYEYSIVFCVVVAALVDVVLAAGYNRTFITESNGRSLTCSYIIICAAAAYIGNVGNPLKVAVTAILAGTILILLAARKKHLLEFVKGIPLALISVLCAWAFLSFGL